MSDSPTMKTIAVIGGTGKEGKGLAYRWAKAGLRVLIGSRSPLKAEIVAKELSDRLGYKAIIEGTSYQNAVQRSDIIALTVPYAAHREALDIIKGGMKGKILIDVTVPLFPPKVTRVKMPPAGSAAQEALGILGEEIQVTSAFQNISSEHLLQDVPVECDVLVTGTSKEARTETLNLVAAAGLTGWDAGPIENSAVVEGLTSILIGINKQYGSKSAGIQITGVQAPAREP
ncbi:MAG: NADPH-dependent F420 reductase [Anaerolineales bacterium]|jgi:NADPH-dependent F420 reductase